MFLLFTFVAFGAWLIWSGFTVADGADAAVRRAGAGDAHGGALPVLAPGRDRPSTRRIVAWSGPRGLSSLLLVLLPVFAGVPGSERLFAITCLVVLLSVVLHGTGIALFLRGARERPTRRCRIDWRPGDPLSRDPDAKSRRRSPWRNSQQLRDAGEPLRAGRRPNRAELPGRQSESAGRHPAPARRCGAPGAASWASSTTGRWCSTVRERTKPQAPGWRESFERQAGPGPAPWWAAGPPGSMLDYRLSREARTSQGHGVANSG